jgi:hypothetical protein
VGSQLGDSIFDGIIDGFKKPFTFFREHTLDSETDGVTAKDTIVMGHVSDPKILGQLAGRGKADFNSGKGSIRVRRCEV